MNQISLERNRLSCGVCWCWYDDNLNIDVFMLVFIQGTCHRPHGGDHVLCIFTPVPSVASGEYQQVPHLSPLSPSSAHLSQQTPTNTIHQCFHLIKVAKVTLNVAPESAEYKKPKSKLSVEQFICTELSCFLSLVSCYRCSAVQTKNWSNTDYFLTNFTSFS